MAGATQRYVRTCVGGSSAFLQREEFAIVAQQGHGLVSYPLREDTAFRLSDGVADRIHVDEPSAIKAKRGLGVEDLANRVVEASAADLATLHCSHHGVE